MAEQLPLDGRVALVTGGGRGLGRAQALTLAAQGARVAVNNRSPDSAASAVEEIKAAGGEAVACPGDLQEPGVAAQVVEAAVQGFGRLDIVVNNAGGIDIPPTPFTETGAAERDALLRQNFTTAWDVTAAAWPHLVAGGYGRIVLFGSPIALFGLPGYAHYAAAKGAVIALSRTLALEGAEHGITVNVINPLANTRTESAEGAWNAWFESSFPAQHVAAALAWLVDERCTATGQVFSIGGTRVARTSVAETRGFVGDAPASDPGTVGEHFATVVEGDAELEFASMGEALGFWGELYAAPGSRAAS